MPKFEKLNSKKLNDEVLGSVSGGKGKDDFEICPTCGVSYPKGTAHTCQNEVLKSY